MPYCSVGGSPLPKVLQVFFRLSRLRAMRSIFCGLSRSSAVEIRLGSNVCQKLYALGATLGRLVRIYDCLILVQEARHCKPEGAE